MSFFKVYRCIYSTKARADAYLDPGTQCKQFTIAGIEDSEGLADLRRTRVLLWLGYVFQPEGLS